MQPGERFIQPDLARTLERIVADPADFYHGEMARQIADYLGKNGGLITAADLAAYECKERAPLVGRYHGYEVLTAPPPSSGGIVLLEILNILSGYDLPKLRAGPQRRAGPRHHGGIPPRVHGPQRIPGRPGFRGDAARADGQRRLCRRLAQDHRPARSRRLPRPSCVPVGFLPPPPAVPPAHESPQTTHFSIVDAEGNAVASTYTLNFPFGSGVTVPGLGFLLNDEMDDFASKMGRAERIRPDPGSGQRDCARVNARFPP